MKLLLELPTGNTRGPVYTESLLRTVHRANPNRQDIELTIQSTSRGTCLGIQCADEFRNLLLQELQDAYPGIVVRPDNEDWQESVSLSVNKHCDVQSIRTYDAFVDETDNRQLADPLSGLFSAVAAGNSGKIQYSVQLSLRPASKRRVWFADCVRRRLDSTFHHLWVEQLFIRLAESRSLPVRCVALIWSTRNVGEIHTRRGSTELATESLFECSMQVSAMSSPEAAGKAKNRLLSIAGTLGRFNTRHAQFVLSRKKVHRRFLLSAKEVATLWHPATESVDAASRIARPGFREIEPPLSPSSNANRSQCTILGRTCFRQQTNQFFISTDDLRRHLISIGKTGCGKSTFLLNVVRQQIEQGRGTVLFDPHGQLADEVLDIIPRHRTNDVVYFDAGDTVAPIRFNPLVGPPGTDANLIADGVLTSFKNVFGFDAGSAPRLLHIFRNALLTLIGTPHASLVGVQRLLVDAAFRRTCIASIENAAVREFWLTEFNQWNERDRTQYIASLQNKLGAFTTNQRLQQIFDGSKKGIVLREIMDQSKILICNLSKGTVGHDASTLLGTLMMSSLQIAAMSRANIPEADRTDCVVVIDEFHSYLADGNSTMADALAESRKYRTSYVLSTQMLDGQLDDATLAGVLGNCGSALCMTVGPRDAETLASLLGNGLTPADLMNIPKYHGYIRMLQSGRPHTFSMTTLAPPRHPPNRADVIRKVSRQTYGTSVT